MVKGVLPVIDAPEQRKKTMIEQWKKELEVGEVTWKSVQEAFATYEGDYGIVDHAGDPVVSVLGEPRRGDHHYSVSGLAGMSEQDFLAAVEGKKTAVLIACMDKRAIADTYDQVREEVGEDVELITLSMGGGIVQEDVITRDKQRVTVNRALALRVITQYIDQVADVVKVVVTGHDRQCGAVKFYKDGTPLHQELGVEKGAPEEQAAMIDMINAKANEILPANWSGVADTRLVTINHDDHFHRMVPTEG